VKSVNTSDKTTLRVPKRLGDFEVRSRMLLVCGLALPVAAVVAMDHILEARLRDVNEERKAERILKLSEILMLGAGRLLMRKR